MCAAPHHHSDTLEEKSKCGYEKGSVAIVKGLKQKLIQRRLEPEISGDEAVLLIQGDHAYLLTGCDTFVSIRKNINKVHPPISPNDFSC